MWSAFSAIFLRKGSIPFSFPFPPLPSLILLLFFLSLLLSVTLITVACLCILCVIVGIIGSLIDGITWSVLDHTRGCYSPYNDVYTGQDSYQTQAMDCVSSSLIGDSSTKGRCYCVQANNAMCYHYTIRDSSKYDCHDLLTQYTHWLHDSMTICIVITLGSLIYSIFLCTGGCSNILNRTQRANTNASGPSGPVTAYPAFMESEDAHRPLIEEATAPEYPIDSFVKQGGGGPVHAQPYNPNYNQKA